MPLIFLLKGFLWAFLCPAILLRFLFLQNNLIGCEQRYLAPNLF